MRVQSRHARSLDATGGRVERPTRMARWMRAINAVEARLSAAPARRRDRAAASGARA
jgi:hypothetical protein